MKYIIIIGGGVLQVPVVHKAHEMGYKTIVSDIDPECACSEITDEFWNIGVFDWKAHLRYIDALTDESNPTEDLSVGCVAIGIDATETASRVNSYVDAWWPPFKASYFTHNKLRFRELQAEHGFHYPWFRKLEGKTTAPMGGAIFKPLSNSASRGIIKYKEGEEIEGSGMIEGILKGKEYSIDTIWSKGTMEVCGITDRFFRDSDRYCIEAGAVHPSSTDREEDIAAEVYKLGGILGIEYGPLKCDILITELGTIFILEAATRYSGGFDCTHLMAHTGKDIIKAAIDCNATGDYNFEDIQGDNGYAMTGSVWPEEGKVVRHYFNETQEYYPRVKVGETIKYRSSADRPGTLVVHGESYLDCMSNMTRDLKKIEIRTE